MNKANIQILRESNTYLMDTLANMRARNDVVDMFSKLHPDCPLSQLENPGQDIINTMAINSAIDAVYMQNKILDHIEMLKDKSCFMTDNEGVIALLERLIAGNAENM